MSDRCSTSASIYLRLQSLDGNSCQRFYRVSRFQTPKAGKAKGANTTMTTRRSGFSNIDGRAVEPLLISTFHHPHCPAMSCHLRRTVLTICSHS